MVESYLTPEADFLLLDGLESVEVFFIRPNASHSVQVPKAMSGSVDLRRDAFADVSIGSSSRAWSFPVSSLEGETLEIGDLIQDEAGIRWEVAGVTLRSFDTIYRAICNRLRRNVSA